MSIGCRRLVAGVCLAGLTMLGAMPALAAGETAEFALTCAQESVQTGQDSSWTLALTRTDLPLTGALLTFAVDDSARLTAVDPAPDIQAGELSYSYQDGVLRIMYMDSQAGEDPLPAGASVAILHFAFENDENGVPAELTESDLCGLAEGVMTDFTATATVAEVPLTGEPVTVEEPEDFYSEAGQAARPVAELTAELAAQQQKREVAGDGTVTQQSGGGTPTGGKENPVQAGTLAGQNPSDGPDSQYSPDSPENPVQTAEAAAPQADGDRTTPVTAVWLASAAVLVMLVATGFAYRRKQSRR